MNELQAAMKAADAQPNDITREEYMFAVALNAHIVAVSPRRLLTGHDVRQVRIMAQMLNDPPRVSLEATRLEVVGDDKVVSSATLQHMASALQDLAAQEEVEKH